MNCRTPISLIGVVLCTILLLPIIVVAQDVLWDNLNSSDIDWVWSHMIDTLEAHGAMVYHTSVEGWTNLMDMDMLWLTTIYYPYDAEMKSRIIDFAEL